MSNQNQFPSLTKENFWDELSEKYPEQMKVFCAWIDEYKKRMGWSSLFTHTYMCGQSITNEPKFHDLPIAMQIGIFIQFCMETPSRYQFLECLPDKMDDFATLINHFFETERDFLADPLSVLSKVGYKNRLSEAIPETADLIKIIVKDDEGENEFLCRWIPSDKKRTSENGFLGAAKVVSVSGLGVGFNAWEQKEYDFIYYKIVKSI